MTYCPNRPPTLEDVIQHAVNGIGYARANNRRPRLHPNGFIQLDLAKDASVRLHVWPAVPLPAQKTRHPIHDHVFDMESTILCGHLRNVLYKALPLSDAEAAQAIFRPYRMYRATRIAKDDTVLMPADEKFYAVVESAHEDLEPGDTYYMQKGLLHDSVPLGLTCTLMYKLDLTWNTGQLWPCPPISSRITTFAVKRLTNLNCGGTFLLRLKLLRLSPSGRRRKGSVQRDEAALLSYVLEKEIWAVYCARKRTEQRTFCCADVRRRPRRAQPVKAKGCCQATAAHRLLAANG